jgi:predicted 3-demethylubiquinone-9 3-methyltransferase (glyoxalase superfamily)
MDAMFSDPDQERADRAMKAMLGMRKIDVAALQSAADGATTS